MLRCDKTEKENISNWGLVGKEEGRMGVSYYELVGTESEQSGVGSTHVNSIKRTKAVIQSAKYWAERFLLASDKHINDDLISLCLKIGTIDLNSLWFR